MNTIVRKFSPKGKWFVRKTFIHAHIQHTKDTWLKPINMTEAAIRSFWEKGFIDCVPVYTQEQLESMTFAEVREIALIYNQRDNKKADLIEKILVAQGR